MSAAFSRSGSGAGGGVEAELGRAGPGRAGPVPGRAGPVPLPDDHKPELRQGAE